MDFSKYFVVFFISMIPIIELRGALPYAAMNGLPYFESYILAVVGNILPIPFVITFFKPMLSIIERIPFLERIYNHYVKKAQKRAEKIQNFLFIGLFIIVALPIPGTGAWSAALVCILLNLRLKYAMLAISSGVIVAGLIMLLLSEGALHILDFIKSSFLLFNFMT